MTNLTKEISFDWSLAARWRKTVPLKWEYFCPTEPRSPVVKCCGIWPLFEFGLSSPLQVFNPLLEQLRFRRKIWSNLWFFLKTHFLLRLRLERLITSIFPIHYWSILSNLIFDTFLHVPSVRTYVYTEPVTWPTEQNECLYSHLWPNRTGVYVKTAVIMLKITNYHWLTRHTHRYHNVCRMNDLYTRDMECPGEYVLQLKRNKGGTK